MTLVLAPGGIGRGGDGETGVMTDGGGPLGDDAYYLEATASVFGWRVTWEPGGTAVRMARGPWRLRVRFRPGGGFRGAVLHSGGLGRWELDLPEVVACWSAAHSADPQAAQTRDRAASAPQGAASWCCVSAPATPREPHPLPTTGVMR